MKLNLLLVLSLLALAAVFVAFDMALPAGVCILAAFFIAIVKVGSDTVKTSKSVGKALGAGIRKDVREAEGGIPDSGVFVKGIENAGDLVADQIHAPDTHQFKYKGIGAVGEACKGLIDSFKKLFR